VEDGAGAAIDAGAGAARFTGDCFGSLCFGLPWFGSVGLGASVAFATVAFGFSRLDRPPLRPLTGVTQHESAISNRNPPAISLLEIITHGSTFVAGCRSASRADRARCTRPKTISSLLSEAKKPCISRLLVSISLVARRGDLRRANDKAN
jgi:hypothetical protein